MPRPTLPGLQSLQEADPFSLDSWFRRAARAWLLNNSLLLLLALLILVIHSKLQVEYLLKWNYAEYMNAAGGCILYKHQIIDEILPSIRSKVILISFVLLPAFCLSCIRSGLQGADLNGRLFGFQRHGRLIQLATWAIQPGVMAVVFPAVLIYLTWMFQICRNQLFPEFLTLLGFALLFSLPLVALFSWMIAVVAIELQFRSWIGKYLLILLLMLPVLVSCSGSACENLGLSGDPLRVFEFNACWIIGVASFLYFQERREPVTESGSR